MEVTSSVLVDMALANPKSHSFTTPAVWEDSYVSSPLAQGCLGQAFKKP